MAAFRTQDYIFWHMIKTGGSWVQRVMVKLLEAERVNGVRQHGPIEILPGDVRGQRKVFGTHRDAWSWYTSLYQHSYGSYDGGNPKLKRWGNGSSTFKDVIYGMTHPQEVQHLEDDFLCVYRFKENGLQLRDDVLKSDVGLFTWTTRWSFGHPIQIDLLLETGRINEALGELFGRNIRRDSWPPQNAATHRPETAFGDPRSMWDDEMISWVREADEEGNSLMGFEEPWGQARSLIVEL